MRGGPRRILHLIDQSGPGGAETIFVELVTRLDPDRWRSHAVIPGPGWVLDALAAHGVRPLLIPAKGGYNRQYLARLIRTIRRLDIELVQTHMFGAGLYGSLAGRICGVPVVSTLHGEPDLPTARQAPFLRYLVLRAGARRVVLVSRALRDLFHGRGSFPAERTRVIHNGIDLDAFHAADESAVRASLGFDPEHVVVGAVGNLRPAKALDVFVQAAAIVAREDSRFRFLIAGDRHGALYPELVRLRDRLGLGDRLSFLGFWPDIERVFRSLDIFVCSSRSEGFSLTTVQAMACGVPVVATRSGGPEEIVTDGVDGLLVPPGVPDGIAAAVLRLSRDERTRRELASRGIERARAHFSIDRMTREYEELYDEVLG